VMRGIIIKIVNVSFNGGLSTKLLFQDCIVYIHAQDI